jgi:hypothetical protein
MTSLAVLVVVPALVQTPALPQITSDSLSVPGFAIERVDTLRCSLLQRDREAQSQGPSCPMPPVILGQWRN